MEFTGVYSDNRSSDTSLSTTSTLSSVSTAVAKSSRHKWMRYTWSSNWEYLLVTTSTCISVTEGLRLTWKSLKSTEPCIAHYLVIYFVILIPVCYTHVFVGQYCQLGISFFKHLAPVGHGVAYCFIMQSVVACAVEGILMAYNILFFLSIFRAKMEWMYCPDELDDKCWGLDNYNDECSQNCLNENTLISATIFFNEVFMSQAIGEKKSTANSSLTQSIMIIFGWIVIYTIANRGLATFIKMIKISMYILIILTFLLLLVCILSNGATIGLSNMFYVPVGSLYSFHAWADASYKAMASMAFNQIYHVTYGSFMAPSMDASTLSTAVVFLNFLFSVIMSSLLYSTIGIIMDRAKIKFKSVVYIWKETFLPQFSVIPQGLGFLGASQLWTAIYFIISTCLLFNGLICKVDIIERNISEAHPRIRSYRSYSIAGISMLCCSLGVVMSSSQYYYVFQEFVNYVHPSSSCFIIMIFSIVVYWIYRVQRLSDDVHFLCGKQPTQYYKMCWYMMPVFCGLTYAHNSMFSNKILRTSRTLHWFTAIVLQFPLAILFIINLFRYLKRRNLTAMIQPEERWGPPDPEDRQLRRTFNPREETRIRRRNDACKHKCLWNSKILSKAVNAEESFYDEEGLHEDSSVNFFFED